MRFARSGTTSLLRKTTTELRIRATEHYNDGVVQTSTFARFLASFDFRLLQQHWAGFAIGPNSPSDINSFRKMLGAGIARRYGWGCVPRCTMQAPLAVIHRIPRIRLLRAGARPAGTLTEPRHADAIAPGQRASVVASVLLGLSRGLCASRSNVRDIAKRSLKAIPDAGVL